MAKRLEDRLQHNSRYKTVFGDRMLSYHEITQLYKFDEEYGFSYDRVDNFIIFIKYGYEDWCDKWKCMRSLKLGTLEFYKEYYGEKDGTEFHKALSLRKTAHFDHSPELQKERSLISANKKRGKTGVSCRSVDFWIKEGLSIEEASAKVKSIQSTNTIKNYIKKYGDDGIEKFDVRKREWTEQMSDPTIGKKRSLGLWRYKERYGEIDGNIKYLEMRGRRSNSWSGKASKESIDALSDVLFFLEKHNIKYYFGIEDNHEWCIYDRDLKKYSFYDLTIPALSIIVEYHGEAFHPNPSWDAKKWSTWRKIYTNETADIAIKVDIYKKELAQNKGWTVFEMYSSEVAQCRQLLTEHFAKLGYAI